MAHSGFYKACDGGPLSFIIKKSRQLAFPCDYLLLDLMRFLIDICELMFLSSQNQLALRELVTVLSQSMPVFL
jgi:hypothetical protein